MATKRRILPPTRKPKKPRQGEEDKSEEDADDHSGKDSEDDESRGEAAGTAEATSGLDPAIQPLECIPLQVQYSTMPLNCEFPLDAALC